MNHLTKDIDLFSQERGGTRMIYRIKFESAKITNCIMCPAYPLCDKRKFVNSVPANCPLEEVEDV